MVNSSTAATSTATLTAIARWICRWARCSWRSPRATRRRRCANRSRLQTTRMSWCLSWNGCCRGGRKGWVTADTHVHFLSPSTALLEGQAEDVHVVNLLASQWGEMFSNVSDFDGRTTLGARASSAATANFWCVSGLKTACRSSVTFRCWVTTAR